MIVCSLERVPCGDGHLMTDSPTATPAREAGCGERSDSRGPGEQRLQRAERSKPDRLGGKDRAEAEGKVGVRGIVGEVAVRHPAEV